MPGSGGMISEDGATQKQSLPESLLTGYSLSLFQGSPLDTDFADFKTGNLECSAFLELWNFESLFGSSNRHFEENSR